MYKRVLIKISGEALGGEDSIFDTKMLDDLAEVIKKVVEMGVEVSIVVGAGNIVRGKFSSELGMNRTQVDHMGMLGTVINALAVSDKLNSHGVDSVVLSAIEMNTVCDQYTIRDAIKNLEQKKVVVFGAGTGHPFFSTDTGSALRAAETNTDLILMAKNGVDGVYSDSPRLNPNAILYDKLSFNDVIEQNLKVMDLAACTICQENNIDIIVFNMNSLENITKILSGERIGTLVTKEK